MIYLCGLLAAATVFCLVEVFGNCGAAFQCVPSDTAHCLSMLTLSVYLLFCCMYMLSACLYLARREAKFLQSLLDKK